MLGIRVTLLFAHGFFGYGSWVMGWSMGISLDTMYLIDAMHLVKWIWVNTMGYGYAPWVVIFTRPNKLLQQMIYYNNLY